MLTFFGTDSETNTDLSDMFADFVEYVYSFYGADDALYPMDVTKVDILSATHDYIQEINTRKDDNFTWGDGDSLDRERVRDILVLRYGYDESFYGGSVVL
tara:strand:+ start:761 stop:1060 length:300 start_codon:yes stop_codon:yes gene_type:complete